MKNIVILNLIFTFILVSTLFPQTIPKVSISGKITDLSTNQPIENVDVFLSFTTRGDITDRNGIYKIENIPVGTYVLVVSLIGYEVIKEEIQLSANATDKYNFRLKLRAIEAPEIEVRATRAHEWRKSYLKFERIFLGTSENSKKCLILNPEYLDFTYPKQSNHFMASSKQPVKVENQALGYQISFNLLDFLSDSFFDTKYIVTAKFTPLQTKDAKEIKSWKKNREKAYKGSMRHFLSSLAAGTLEDDKFEVYQTSKISAGLESTYYQKLKMEEALIKGKSEYERKLTFNNYLKIIYNGEYEPVEYAYYGHAAKSCQISWIELIQDTVTFNTNGILYEPYSVLTYGYWAWERAAEMLPLDYKPDSE